MLQGGREDTAMQWKMAAEAVAASIILALGVRVPPASGAVPASARIARVSSWRLMRTPICAVSSWSIDGSRTRPACRRQGCGGAVTPAPVHTWHGTCRG